MLQAVTTTALLWLLTGLLLLSPAAFAAPQPRLIRHGEHRWSVGGIGDGQVRLRLKEPGHPVKPDAPPDRFNEDFNFAVSNGTLRRVGVILTPFYCMLFVVVLLLLLLVRHLKGATRRLRSKAASIHIRSNIYNKCSNKPFLPNHRDAALELKKKDSGLNSYGLDSTATNATRHVDTITTSNASITTSISANTGSTRWRKPHATRKDSMKHSSAQEEYTPPWPSPGHTSYTLPPYSPTVPPRPGTPESVIHPCTQYPPTIPYFYTPPPSPTREATSRPSCNPYTPTTDAIDPNLPWATLKDSFIQRNKNMDALLIPWDEYDSTTAAPAEGGGIVHKRKHLILDGSSDASSSLSTLIPIKDISFISIIGGGGFGQVWSATWKGTPVAVKQLAPSWIMDESQILRDTTQDVSKVIPPSPRPPWNHKILQEFCAEIHMLRAMRHPNICLYMGACWEFPHLAIVTELATHGSLWDALRLPIQISFLCRNTSGSSAGSTSTTMNMEPTSSSWPTALYGSNKNPMDRIPVGTWPWSLVKRIATGAARGMNYLHSGDPPILHRDLKSANILLDESYHAKIGDFGFSRLKAQHTQSMTGNCGTVQWMAPEILSNQPYAEPADVYSFGIILWELLSRECPFEGLSAIQCALAVINTDARPTIPPWCPDCLASLIQSCIQKNPSCRPSFGQIIQAFDTMPS